MKYSYIISKQKYSKHDFNISIRKGSDIRKVSDVVNKIFDGMSRIESAR